MTGVLLGPVAGTETEAPEEIEALIAARDAARRERNFSEADAIRDQLNEMGIVLEDSPQGTRWRKA
jgi:cysteinyl-tRNA synthetase